MPLRAKLASAVALVAIVSGCTSCSVHNLSFVQDKRLHIISPAQRSTVTLPVTVRWRMPGFATTPPRPAPSAGPRNGPGYFALFVDRAPVPGGRPLSDIAKGDPNCRAIDGCPNADYYAAHDVYLTAAHHYTFANLPQPELAYDKNKHTITIILVDAAGQRIGESAWSVTFTAQPASVP